MNVESQTWPGGRDMTIKAPSVEKRMAEALHRSKAVGGPWRPCGPAFDCDCISMAKHLIADLADCGATVVTLEEWLDAVGPIKAQSHEHTYVWTTSDWLEKVPPLGCCCIDCGHRYGGPETEA